MEKDFFVPDYFDDLSDRMDLLEEKLDKEIYLHKMDSFLINLCLGVSMVCLAVGLLFSLNKNK